MKDRNKLQALLIFTVVSVLSLALLPQCKPDSARQALVQENPESPDPVLHVQKRYGIPVQDFRLITKQVGRNQVLADLLLPYGIGMQEVMEIAALPDSLINERRIRQGNHYTLFLAPDSTLSYFAYEKDALNYVVIDFQEGVKARSGRKNQELRLKKASGSISSSLWLSMRDNNINPLLANELSEIFAWSIDFFGIQKGDQFKVIYEEAYIDTLSLGINRVLGAWFRHNGAEFWAIPFRQDGNRSFFDEEGNSLRKAFLKAPLRYSRISSGFSNSRLHPVLKIRRPHHGVDYAAPTGTPVHSVGDGVVTRVGYQARGGGNYIKIKHNSVYSTTYMHLKGFARGMKGGVYVKQGDVIGYVGSTGLATGPHLDFRFYKNGHAVNPLKVEAPPVEPVAEQNQLAFGLKRTLVMQLLEMMRVD